jgi:outer membrane receptor protein involved in Fe transport
MKPLKSQSLVLGLTFGTAVAGFAQAVDPARTEATTTNRNEDVVMLEAFTVDSARDVGYVAVDSLAGGRANLPLRVTAAPISSMTRAFIDDVQITNIRDALRWTGGAVPQNWRGGRSGGGSQFNAWAFSVRGQGALEQGGNPPSRNYFPNYVVQDLYNVDRVEAARGPNSILFGVGDIGGSIATYTKVPRIDRSFEDTVLQVNNYGGVRWTTDINHIASDRLAVRLNTLAERERGWRDSDRGRSFAADLHVLWKLNERSQLRVELEAYDRKNNLYGFTYQDQFSLWNGTTAPATWGETVTGAELDPTKNPGAPGVKRMRGWGSTYLIVVPGLESAGVLDWSNGYRSMGTGDIAWGAYLRPYSYTFGPTNTVVAALPSDEFTVAPENGYLHARYAAATVNFDHRINENMELQLSAYHYTDSQKSKNYENATQAARDVNRQLPNGQPNPNFGKLYSDVFLTAQNQFHPATELRGQLNYHFDTEVFGAPLKQWFAVSGGYRRTELEPRTYLAFVKPGITANDWIENMVWGRLYWDNPRARIDPPNNVTYQAMPFNWFDFNLKETIKYAGVVSQSRFWNDRLNVTLGARRDRYSNHKVGIRGTNNVPTSITESGTTYQAGVIGYVTKWLGLTYNYSENFAPLAGGVAPTLYGENLGAAEGKGQTIGIRISTEDGKYYASASYYKDESTGRPRSGAGFQGVWNRYLDAGGTMRNIGPAGVITGQGASANASMSFTDTTDLEAHGYEFEFVGNPTPNIRIQMNLALPEAELSNTMPGSRRYFAEHIADWEATANEPSADPAIQAERNSLKTDLANLRRDIDAAAAPAVNGGLVEYTFSFFGTYTFPEHVLKGWAVGAGVTALGDQYANPSDLVNGQRIKSPGYETYNAMVSYSTRINMMNRDVRAKFQLNVDNVLGKDVLIFRSYQAYGGGRIEGMDYDFMEPRRFTVTASFSF